MCVELESGLGCLKIGGRPSFVFQASIKFCPQQTKETRNLTNPPNLPCSIVGSHSRKLIKVINIGL
jgi:hypothetical protein